MLEGMLSYLDRDLKELRDEQFVARKEFIKKMQNERKRQLHKKRDPSPGDVLMSAKTLKKRNINMSESMKVIKKKQIDYFVHKELGFDSKPHDKLKNNGRLSNLKAKMAQYY